MCDAGVYQALVTPLHSHSGSKSESKASVCAHTAGLGGQCSW